MNRIFAIIIGILGVSNIAYSFYQNPEFERLFGIDMNVWIYRLIWAALAAKGVYDFFTKKNPEQLNQN
ncbi:hypothetical protein [Formosa haliotis]|uniref:hypothetical protein n=1 Tax=Formosa haliotis TaxID=1555194 RepID=UPI0008247AC7|nr:hypothetical protein [Formosa haliotis]